MTVALPATDAPRLYRRAEETCADELARLATEDAAPRPAGWRLSPKAVVRFVLGDQTADPPIAPKYFGERRKVETAVATLATDRALLLIGPPGGGKSRLAEHLAAAISGASDLLIQGSAGLDESHLRYGWNYPELLARGPSRAALTPTPLMLGMAEGRLVRIEELTRIAPETQDALLTPLSEKTLPIPELADMVDAIPGFNVIATANDQDRGVNALSAALRRRFNVVALPPPASLAEEVEIVCARLSEMGAALDLPTPIAPRQTIERVAMVFRDLRAGRTTPEPGAETAAFQRPSGAVSTADAIAGLLNAWVDAAFLRDGAWTNGAVAEAIIGAAVADPRDDAEALRAYLDIALTPRGEADEDWRALSSALAERL